MNFLKGNLESWCFMLDDGFPLPLGANAARMRRDGVVYGIRPEHLVLSDDGLPVDVAVVEQTGSETQLITRHGSQIIVCIFRERILPRVGETIRVAPDVSKIHLFSKQDGSRLQ